MKRLIYTMLFLCPIVAFAQYAPFPTPRLEFGSIYNCNVFDCPDYYNNSIRYVGDVDLCGKTWNKFEALPLLGYYTYMRADSGKYYSLNFCSNERLYYDFSKQTGDTLNLWDLGKVRVLETGLYTLDNGETRKKMLLKSITNSPFDPIYTWVDGIGDIENGFFRRTDFEGGNEQLICMRDAANGVFYHSTARNLNCDSLLCPQPKPKFDYDCTSVTFHFINQTQQADTYRWDFGDGQSSTEAEPTHIYGNPGCYQVTLIAKSACLPQDYITKRRISVEAPNHWKPANIPTPETLRKVQFLTPQKAWAIGPHTIWKTEDGGMHWDSTIYPGPVRPLKDLHFKDFEHGIIQILKPGTPYYSELLWTNDGLHWELDTVDYKPTITAIQRVSDSVAIISAHYQNFFTSKDAGHTWTYTHLQNTGVSLIYDFESIGGDTIYCIGTNQILPPTGTIYFIYSSDALHWQQVLTPATGIAMGIDFVDADNGWFAAGSSVYHTTDAGQTWTLQAELPVQILDIRFSDKLHGWATGSYSGVYATSDGGQTWIQQSCARTETVLSSLNVFNSEKAYLLAPEGILEYSQIPDSTNLCSTSGIPETGFNTEQLFSIRPNPANYTIDIQWNTNSGSSLKQEIVLSNLQGIEMLRIKATDASNISVAHLPVGMYLVQALVDGRRKGNVGKLLICR